MTKYKLYVLLLLSISLLNLNATPIISEYWIHPYSTGLKDGSLQDPFDGSTRLLFDAKMSTLTTTGGKCVIHLLPGTYDTAGWASWTLRTGQTISGSGIDVTTIRLAAWTADSRVISSQSSGSTMQVKDLTVDCNYQNSGGGAYTTSGVILDGNNNAIRRVKCINAAGANTGQQQAFCLWISGSATDALIEGCEVSAFNTAGGGYASGIVFTGSPAS